MNTDYELNLMQLSDSLFPSGMFSMSNGLEANVLEKKIINADDVTRFLQEQIQFQILPLDCKVLLMALAALKNKDTKKLIEIDKSYYSMKLSREVRNSSIRSGRQIFNSLLYMSEQNEKIILDLKNILDSHNSPLTYPMVLAVASFILKIPEISIARLLLYTFCSNTVSAAIRLGIIQHYEAQKILKKLNEMIVKFQFPRLHTNEGEFLWQVNPLTEILQMKNEKNDYRMFIT